MIRGWRNERLCKGINIDPKLVVCKQLADHAAASFIPYIFGANAVK
jgi:hypothetical protein